jgi:hypothetical protein
MSINSVTITTSAETVNTYFITTYERTVFVKTAKSKIHSLLALIESLGIGIEEWGEMSDFDDIYEF